MKELRFNEEELVSFGNYLLSPLRMESYVNHPEYPNGELLEERMSQVSDADLQNWYILNRNNKLNKE